MSPIRVADDVYEIPVDTPQAAQALAHQLRANAIGEDVVAGLTSVCVCFHPNQAGDILALILSAPDDVERPNIKNAIMDIGVVYGGEHGPDLQNVCAALELSETDFIAMHTTPVHTVEMIGFTPGFAYISGLPEGASIPRLREPRARVPAGSVGISAAFTGLYALAGPGGWPLIGRTSMSLFNPESETPFPLQPGQQVRFKAI